MTTNEDSRRFYLIFPFLNILQKNLFFTWDNNGDILQNLGLCHYKPSVSFGFFFSRIDSIGFNGFFLAAKSAGVQKGAKGRGVKLHHSL